MKSDRAKVNVHTNNTAELKFHIIFVFQTTGPNFFPQKNLNPGPLFTRPKDSPTNLSAGGYKVNLLIYKIFYFYYKLFLSAITCTPDSKAAAPGGTTAAASASGISRKLWNSSGSTTDSAAAWW